MREQKEVGIAHFIPGFQWIFYQTKLLEVPYFNSDETIAGCIYNALHISSQDKLSIFFISENSEYLYLMFS